MLARLIPDRFVAMLLATIVFATVLPAQGGAVPVISATANIAIFSLFFFHGLRIAHDAVWNGLRHWPRHVASMACDRIADGQQRGDHPTSW